MRRPAGSACVCNNVRPMPGGWLRLKSGRIARTNLNGIRVNQIIPSRLGYAQGSQYHLVETVPVGGTDAGLYILDTAAWSITGVADTITNTQDANVPNEPKAWAHLPNSIVYYNGKGYRGNVSTTPSYPAMSMWQWPNVRRHYGLYPTVKGAGPQISVAAGSGYNQVSNYIKLWVGLYNEATEHYSIGVQVWNAADKKVAAFSGPATLSLTDLDEVTAAYHDSTEQAELYYVFYASAEGLDTPYLIMNAALDGPYKVAYGSATASLSILDDTANGWQLDSTKQIPSDSYPPRRMLSLAYANNRLYGILHPSIPPTNAPEYAYSEKDLAGAVWSHAEGSTRQTDFLGDPLQSWPLKNYSPIPSAERPLKVFPSTVDTDVLYFCPRSVWTLREASDGLHEWYPVTTLHGIVAGEAAQKVVVKTRHGICWVTNRNQLAIYTNEGEFKILSSDYDSILSNEVSIHCASYVYDPINYIDRYQVYYADRGSNSSLCHDFRLGAYTTTEPERVFHAASLHDDDDQVYHVVATGVNGTRAGISSIEGNPDQGGRIPMRDQVFSALLTPTVTSAEISDGYFVTNWSDFGDPTMRHELSFIDIIGDCATSAQLGAVPLTIEYYKGFGPIAASGGTTLTPTKIGQETTDQLYRAKLTSKHGTWWKFRIRIRSHSQDYAVYPSYHFAQPSDEGDLSSNFYGSLMSMHLHKTSLNRKP